MPWFCFLLRWAKFWIKFKNATCITLWALRVPKSFGARLVSREHATMYTIFRFCNTSCNLNFTYIGIRPTTHQVFMSVCVYLFIYYIYIYNLNFTYIGIRPTTHQVFMSVCVYLFIYYIYNLNFTYIGIRPTTHQVFMSVCIYLYIIYIYIYIIWISRISEFDPLPTKYLCVCVYIYIYIYI